MCAFLICSFTEMVFTFAGWDLKMHLSFVEGKKKIGLENMNVCLYNESRKINSMYDCERPWNIAEAIASGNLTARKI